MYVIMARAASWLLECEDLLSEQGEFVVNSSSFPAFEEGVTLT